VAAAAVAGGSRAGLFCVALAQDLSSTWCPYTLSYGLTPGCEAELAAAAIIAVAADSASSLIQIDSHQQSAPSFHVPVQLRVVWAMRG
jgi:hypothetical protein